MSAIMITGAGRRYDIVASFAQHTTVVATETNRLAPGQYAAQIRAIVPRIDDPAYVPELRRLCASRSLPDSTVPPVMRLPEPIAPPPLIVTPIHRAWARYRLPAATCPCLTVASRGDTPAPPVAFLGRQDARHADGPPTTPHPASESPAPPRHTQLARRETRPVRTWQSRAPSRNSFN